MRFYNASSVPVIPAALSIKEGFYTVLSRQDVLPEVERILTHDAAAVLSKSQPNLGVR